MQSTTVLTAIALLAAAIGHLRRGAALLIAVAVGLLGGCAGGLLAAVAVRLGRRLLAAALAAVVGPTIAALTLGGVFWLGGQWRADSPTQTPTVTQTASAPAPPSWHQTRKDLTSFFIQGMEMRGFLR